MTSASAWIQPVALEGSSVRLEPVEERHLDGLFAAATHDEIWRWMPSQVKHPDDMRSAMDFGFQLRRSGTGQAFAIRELASGIIVGSTAYLNANEANRRVEIGSTWVTPAWQRTSINTECKLLLMRNAFEILGANRVEFKTDSNNTQSRTAIARLGAVEEGTLRNHVVRADGTLRHSVYSSVTVEEWPVVERGLTDRLAAYGWTPSCTARPARR